MHPLPASLALLLCPTLAAQAEAARSPIDAPTQRPAPGAQHKPSTQDKPGTAGKSAQKGKPGDPAQVPSRSELARKVTSAHAAKTAAAVDRFKARISVLLREAQTKQAVSVLLDVCYGSKIQRSKSRSAAMGRFTFLLENQTLGVGPLATRGFGPWLRKDGKTRPLTGRTDTQTSKNLKSYLSLCKQMLRFFDPGAVLAELKGKDPVRAVSQERFWQDKKVVRRDAWIVGGVLDEFPRFRDTKSGSKERVRLKVWVDQETGRLLQLEITPLGATGLSQGGHSELVHFASWHPKLVDGRRIPRLMRIRQLKAGKPQRGFVQVEVQGIALNPKLSKSDFTAPR